MPCNSSYMEPNHAEKNSKQVAENLVYVYTALGVDAPQNIINASSSCYGDPRSLNSMVVELCALISNMTKEEELNIVYDGRVGSARKLADWWDKHKAADAKRSDEELVVSMQTHDKNAALSKLTPYEKELLGLK